MGDSHALQYAPGMIALAKHRGWRLESLTMAGCTVATVHLRQQVGQLCDRWRENTLRRIERARPALVVVTTGTVDRYAVRDAAGRPLDHQASEPLLEAGMRRTLKRLRATGAEVVVLRPGHGPVRSRRLRVGAPQPTRRLRLSPPPPGRPGCSSTATPTT
jgi:hypothetical protein